MSNFADCIEYFMEYTHPSRSLVSDFKLTQENDDLLCLGHRQIFEVPHPVHEYTKMRIPNKRYLTNTAHIF